MSWKSKDARESTSALVTLYSQAERRMREARDRAGKWSALADGYAAEMTMILKLIADMEAPPGLEPKKEPEP